MTPRQRKLLFFIHRFIQQHGWSPSYTEITEAGIYGWKCTVFYNIHRLAEFGYLTIQPNRARGIEILKLPQQCAADTGCCPACGQAMPGEAGSRTVPLPGDTPPVTGARQPQVSAARDGLGDINQPRSTTE